MSVLAQDCGFGDVACGAREAASSVFEDIVLTVATGAAELVVSFAAWWAETDSVNPLDNAVVSAQAATRPVILVVLVGAVLVQSIRIMLSRKGEPLLMVLTGLVRYGVVSALGLTTLQISLKAGDALAADLLDGAVGNFAQLMQDLLTNGEGDAIFLVLLVSLIAAVLSLVQWVLMAMRQAGLLVLAAMLPLAASGSLTRSTRGWLDKLMVWLIAMVVYKPAAAFIYYIGFSYMASPSAAVPGSSSTATMLTGIMVLLLAVIAMPVLLKFFAWSGTQIGGGSGGGSGFLGAVGAVAMSRDQGRGAVDRAAAMEGSGPGSYATFGHYPPGAGAAPPAGAAPYATASGAASAMGGAAGAGAAATVGAAAVRTAGRGMTGGGTDDGAPR